MACVRCDMQLPFVACTACGSQQVRALGIGVTRLRSELARAFPATEVVEASGEASPLPEGPCIVAGTRVALRHRAAFDLVVLADPDALLGRPGIRGEEAAFGLIVDAVASARGRREGGRVLVQTRRPGHPALAALVAADASGWEQALLESRRSARWPPFRRMLSIEAAAPEPVDEAAVALDAIGAEIFGPRRSPRPGLLALVEPAAWAKAASAARDTVLANPDVRVRVEADPLDPH